MEQDRSYAGSDGAYDQAVGVDAAPANRPGVPAEAAPHPASGAHWTEPARQTPPPGGHLKRAGLKELTPVFGTAQPPHGASGALRRVAYGIPEHFARRWMLLLLADRVDVVESRLGEAVGAPLRAIGLRGLGERVRSNPLPFAAVGIGAIVLAARARR